jgi:mono/diheme cytochrome c family protein
MNAYTELIDKYLNNELSAEERRAFEEQLKTDPALKTEFDLQAQVIKGVQRMGLKKQVKTSFQKTKTTKTITKAAIAIGITVAVLATGYFVKKQLTKENELKYELNEEGNRNWSEADKVLPSQIFRIDPTRDTVIESKEGILFAIKAGTFLNKFGEAEKKPIDLEIKEALNSYDILQAGLSTMSDGALLETGGMFYINAREGTENLSIDQGKPIQTNVPYGGDRNDMMLFDGKREKDGSINWVNPVKTIKQLTTTDILSLNFYPPGYLDSLQNWGYNSRDKKFTDSLYYSFICGGMQKDTTPAHIYDYEVQEDSTLTDKMKKIFAYQDSIDKVWMKEQEENIKKYEAQRLAVSKIDGEALFMQNCTVCHDIGNKHLTGPGMRDVEKRVPSNDWLLHYIKNPEKMIKSGDAYANKILRENGGAVMTVFEGTLSDNEILAIINYITENNGGIKLPYTSTEVSCPEIDPARIKALWDPKFNNTFLATHEFEERMQAIFTTCQGNLLQLYQNNLDRPLYELDSVAATLCYGPQKSKFLDFYKRHDGGVQVTNEQMKDLQRYANEKRKLYEKVARETMQKLAKEEDAKMLIAAEKVNQHEQADLIREHGNFDQEFEMNLKEAYRQLGKPYNPTPPPTAYVSGPIITTGWKNVDAYVFESTANRTTLNYTDPESGKKAVIEYKAITVKVDNQENYDKVVAYLLPNMLSSFQLLKQQGDHFEEKLNGLMKYDLVVVGFKGEEVFYSQTYKVQPEAYSVSLKETSKKDLEAVLNEGHSVSQSKDILSDFDFQVFNQKESIRRKKIEEREKFKMKVSRIVYPCTSSIIMGDSSSYPILTGIAQ